VISLPYHNCFGNMDQFSTGWQQHVLQQVITGTAVSVADEDTNHKGPWCQHKHNK
jgi:hypothetical protein